MSDRLTCVFCHTAGAKFPICERCEQSGDAAEFRAERVGCDHVVECQVDSRVLGIITGTLVSMWPSMVFEDARSDEPLRLDDFSFMKRSVFEFFVYRDEAAAAWWWEAGATEETEDTMIHLILEWNRVTVVTDWRRGSVTGAYAESIRKQINAASVGRSA